MNRKKLTISLTPEHDQFIQSQLQSSKYSSADALIREALELLEERHRHYEKWVEEARKKVAVGIE